jgi:hypothetical protein
MLRDVGIRDVIAQVDDSHELFNGFAHKFSERASVRRSTLTCSRHCAN